MRVLPVSLIALAMAGSLAWAKPSITVNRHYPNQLFSPEEPVQFDIALREIPFSNGELQAVVTDFDKAEVWKQTLPLSIAGKKPLPLSLSIGKLPKGYYELTLKAVATGSNGDLLEFPGKATFGVAPFVKRTAKEARDGGYVFGLKWWNGVKFKREAVDSLTRLGLQWTRIVQNQSGELTTAQMLSEFPMNGVIKVERFPQELFDDQRYGPLEEWQKAHGKGFALKTLPKKEPYQAWLREQIAALPADQQVFEIWNEPWSQMSAEDFATISQWVAEAILKDRPNAIIGPNLSGETSAYEYDAKVIKAGGLKQMKMVALHPYGKALNREWLREYKGWLNKETGTDMQIYITEFGGHSAPEGPLKRSERGQATSAVMQSLALYAEGVKALTPHWLGQSEKNPKYHEDWYGYIRKNEEPKPALIALATCARMVDGNRYVGDLWYGPNVGAMLFERGGVYTMALWTRRDKGTPEDDDSISKEIIIHPGTKSVTMVNLMGRETLLPVNDEGLRVKLSEAVVYLTGVDKSLERLASKELRPDRWPQPPCPPRWVRIAKKVQTTPSIDGNFAGWQSMTQLGLTNPKVNGDDCSGVAYFGWDEHYLYIGADLRDNELLNKMVKGKLYQQDCIELFIGTAPRDKDAGFSPTDHQFFAAPTSDDSIPYFLEVVDGNAGVVKDVPGVKYFAGKTGKGWAEQIAIPWTFLKEVAPESGTAIAFEMLVSDADTSHPRFKIPLADKENATFGTGNPTTWSLLKLEE